jgi:hypothetical protein
MKKVGLLLVFAATLSFTQQTAPVQLTQVPPKPTCVVILQNGSCADLWRAYNQAAQQRTREEIQLYVNRQKELASSQATAPLQQQIAGLNKLVSDQQEKIKSLQEELQSDATAALQAKTDAGQAKAEAHTQGMQKGAGLGAGGMLLFVGIVFGIRKMTQGFIVTKKVQAKAASV